MKLFVIDAADNVATALEDVPVGEIAFGGGAEGLVQVLEPIERGHKAALREIPEGTAIIKHGHPVAIARRDISAGEWVHTHNARSRYDKE